MPAVVVRIPGMLSRYADGDRRITVEARTAGEALERLDERHRALDVHLFDDGGGLRPHLQLFHEGTQVDADRAGEVPVADGDEVVVVQAVSGG